MSIKKVKTPLGLEELEEIIPVYNAYVRELNIREKDLTQKVPSDRDHWSPLVSLLHPTLHPERNACFIFKENPNRLITIGLRGITCFRDGTALKNEISVKNVRTAYSEIFSRPII